MESRSRVVALASLTTVAVLVVDQVVKVAVRQSVQPGERTDLLGSALGLVHVQNEGVAFGRLSGSGSLVALVVILALGALLAYFLTHLAVPLVWLPTGLVLGGALGNVVDRVRAGSVTDYLKLPHWPAFNLADLCITVGVIALLLVVESDARRRGDSGVEAGDGTADRA